MKIVNGPRKYYMDPWGFMLTVHNNNGAIWVQSSCRFSGGVAD